MVKRREREVKLLEDKIADIERLQALRDAGILRQRDYWLLTGNYIIKRNVL